MGYNTPLHELYNKFDGPDGNTRLAYYGQCRAMGESHDEAIQSTYQHFRLWCQTYWPKRNIPLPD